MKSPDRLALLLAALTSTLLPARRAAAEFDPVVPEELPRLVQKRAKLHPARPCSGRGPGTALHLYPGDVVMAVSLHRFGGGSQPSPTFVEVELVGDARGAQRQVLHIEDLSKRPLDYSYRGRQSFDAFWTGLVVDAPRLMDLYQKIVARSGDRLPSYDSNRKKMQEDWHRLQHLQHQLQFVRMRLFDRAYGHHDERSLIEREKDWLPAKGEAFITEYAGQLSSEKRKRMQEAYLVMNSLANVPSFCARISELQRTIDQPASQEKYRDLEPAHRARLHAEDIARHHTAITELKSKVVVTLSDARARLLAVGIKAR